MNILKILAHCHVYERLTKRAQVDFTNEAMAAIESSVEPETPEAIQNILSIYVEIAPLTGDDIDEAATYLNGYHHITNWTRFIIDKEGTDNYAINEFLSEVGEETSIGAEQISRKVSEQGWVVEPEQDEIVVRELGTGEEIVEETIGLQHEMREREELATAEIALHQLEKQREANKDWWQRNMLNPKFKETQKLRAQLYRKKMLQSPERLEEINRLKEQMPQAKSRTEQYIEEYGKSPEEKKEYREGEKEKQLNEMINNLENMLSKMEDLPPEAKELLKNRHKTLEEKQKLEEILPDKYKEYLQKARDRMSKFVGTDEWNKRYREIMRKRPEAKKKRQEKLKQQRRDKAMEKRLQDLKRMLG